MNVVNYIENSRKWFGPRMFVSFQKDGEEKIFIYSGDYIVINRNSLSRTNDRNKTNYTNRGLSCFVNKSFGFYICEKILWFVDPSIIKKNHQSTFPIGKYIR